MVDILEEIRRVNKTIDALHENYKSNLETLEAKKRELGEKYEDLLEVVTMCPICGTAMKGRGTTKINVKRGCVIKCYNHDCPEFLNEWIWFGDTLNSGIKRYKGV